jgi:cytosine/adenosine deaminase-related metal-dependent hydrolase
VRILTLFIVTSLLLLTFTKPVLGSDLALVGARVYLSPTDPPIENATILVHNGRITAVGPSASTKPPRFARAVTIINCRGMVVTAGFWNSHVHIMMPGLLHVE